MLGNPVAPATITIDYPQTATQASDDSAKGIAPGDIAKIDILDNDTDAEDDTDPSTVDLNSSVADAILTDSDDDGDIDTIVVPGEGTWHVDEDGLLTFTPEDDFKGDPTPITYRVKDKTGNVSDETTVTVDYAQAIVAVDDNATGEVGDPVEVDLLANDTATLPLLPESVRLVADDGSLVTKLVVDGEGVWSVDSATGAVTFTPEDGFKTNPTPVLYRVSDSEGNVANAMVRVVYNEDIPTAVKDATIEITSTGGTVIDVLKNDSFGNDGPGVGTIELVDPPKYGEVFVDDHGTPDDPTDDVFVYVPYPNSEGGKDTFTYQIVDANGDIAVATVELDVKCTSTQRSDGGSALGIAGMLLMGMLMMFVYRKEEE
jgi:CshA-type fibril repeat protein